jgi:chemotaxis protein methyltransferase CheR
VGLTTFRDYLDYLKRGHEEEWESFVNSLTTNLTDFFRESHHFTLLADFLKHRHERPITLWSSASSTGEEPYSMAMTAVEAFGGFNAPVRIVATDLDTNVLKKCQDGIYSMDRLKKLSPERQSRFFLKGTGDKAGYARVRPELRAMVEFFQLNLLAPNWAVRHPMDAIFCRNVMIYFDKPTQHKILARMKPLLKPDGLLFMGHSEALYHAADLFKLRGQTVYEHANANPRGAH